MTWYQYLASFLAGAFLANAVPHFVHGVSGDPFPSPFAHPPGKGLSSPLVNVIWGILNLILGYILLRVGLVSPGNHPAVAFFFAGIAAMGIMLSVQFQKKHSR